MNILDTEISYYPNKSSVKSLQTVNLYEYLTKPTPERIARVEAIRTCPDAAEQKRLKLTVGCITPSGVFTPERNASSLVRHSGIISLDIDADANPGVNFEALKAEVHRLSWVAACMYSIRGQGLVLYVPIKHPDQHKAHFLQLFEDFTKLGIKIDPSCKDVCRLRFDTYDAHPYINTSAQVYARLKTATVQSAVKGGTHTYTHQSGDVFSWAVSRVEQAGVHFVQGSRHTFIFRLSALLNKAGVSESDTRGYVYTHLLPESEIRSNCISYPYKFLAHEHGTLNYRAGGVSSYTTSPIRYVTHRTHQIKSKRSEETSASANLPIPAPLTQNIESDQPQPCASITKNLRAVEDDSQHTNTHTDDPVRPYLLFQKNSVKKITALLSADGRLFIETPPSYDTFTVYSSIEAYNSRSERPIFIAKDEVNGHGFTVVFIELNHLMIQPPASCKTNFTL
jgi:hypothetical protein